MNHENAGGCSQADLFMQMACQRIAELRRDGARLRIER